MSRKNAYIYDANGNRVEAAAFKQDGSLFYKTTWKYDEHGNQIEMNDYDSKNTLTNQSLRVIEYDKQGNWIKRTETVNEKPIQIAVREIEYYL